jgi:hypothetical protein
VSEFLNVSNRFHLASRERMLKSQSRRTVLFSVEGTGEVASLHLSHSGAAFRLSRACHHPDPNVFHPGLSRGLGAGHYFRDTVLRTICPRLALNHNPPDVCLLSS